MPKTLADLEVPHDSLNALLEINPDYETDTEAIEDALKVAVPIVSQLLDGLAAADDYARSPEGLRQLNARILKIMKES